MRDSARKIFFSVFVCGGSLSRQKSETDKVFRQKKMKLGLRDEKRSLVDGRRSLWIFNLFTVPPCLALICAQMKSSRNFKFTTFHTSQSPSSARHAKISRQRQQQEIQNIFGDFIANRGRRLCCLFTGPDTRQAKGLISFWRSWIV